MRWTEALQGVRVLKFRGVLGCYESTELHHIEAAELLGITERTFRRWCVRFEAEGEAGLLDRRLGKASPKRVPPDSEQEIERLYRARYQGFTARIFTSTWFATISSPAATPRPRRYCNRGGYRSVPRSAASIVASGRGVRCWAGCCIRTALGMNGWQRAVGNWLRASVLSCTSFAARESAEVQM